MFFLRRTSLPSTTSPDFDPKTSPTFGPKTSPTFDQKPAPTFHQTRRQHFMKRVASFVATATPIFTDAHNYIQFQLQIAIWQRVAKNGSHNCNETCAAFDDKLAPFLDQKLATFLDQKSATFLDQKLTTFGASVWVQIQVHHK